MLDDTDIKILRALQGNGRIKRNEIADQIGLSIPSVSEDYINWKKKDY